MTSPSPEYDSERQIRIIQEMERQFGSRKVIGQPPEKQAVLDQIYIELKRPRWDEFEGITPARGWRLFCANTGLLALTASGFMPPMIELMAWHPRADYDTFPDFSILTPLGIGVSVVSESVRAFINKRSNKRC